MVRPGNRSARGRAGVLGVLVLLGGMSAGTAGCTDGGTGTVAGTTAEQPERMKVQRVALAESPVDGGAGDAAVYFTITGGRGDDVLIGATVEADVAADAAVGSLLFWDAVDENGDLYGGTEFEPDEGVDIPARTRVEFSPSTHFVLLEGLVAPLEPGDAVTVTLRFEVAGEVTVDAPFRG